MVAARTAGKVLAGSERVAMEDPIAGRGGAVTGAVQGAVGGSHVSPDLRARYTRRMAGIAALIEAERPRLAQMLGTPSVDIVEVDEGHIRVASDRLTIHFYAPKDETVIHSSLELPSVPEHRVPLTSHLHCWLVLRSRGAEWPGPESEGVPMGGLSRELERLETAIAILSDETSLRETLLWEAGYMTGYSSWA